MGYAGSTGLKPHVMRSNGVKKCRRLPAGAERGTSGGSVARDAGFVAPETAIGRDHGADFGKRFHEVLAGIGKKRRERFEGLKIIEVPVQQAIKDPAGVLTRAGA